MRLQGFPDINIPLKATPRYEKFIGNWFELIVLIFPQSSFLAEMNVDCCLLTINKVYEKFIYWFTGLLFKLSKSSACTLAYTTNFLYSTRFFHSDIFFLDLSVQ